MSVKLFPKIGLTAIFELGENYFTCARYHAMLYSDNN